MTLFMGISFLATRLAIVLTDDDSVLSQMTRIVAGSSFNQLSDCADGWAPSWNV